MRLIEHLVLTTHTCNPILFLIHFDFSLCPVFKVSLGAAISLRILNSNVNKHGGPWDIQKYINSKNTSYWLRVRFGGTKTTRSWVQRTHFLLAMFRASHKLKRKKKRRNKNFNQDLPQLLLLRWRLLPGRRHMVCTHQWWGCKSLVLSALDEEFSTFSQYIRDCKRKTDRKRHKRYKDFHGTLHIYNFIENCIDRDDEKDGDIYKEGQ